IFSPVLDDHPVQGVVRTPTATEIHAYVVPIHRVHARAAHDVDAAPFVPRDKVAFRGIAAADRVVGGVDNVDAVLAVRTGRGPGEIGRASCREGRADAVAGS